MAKRPATLVDPGLDGSAHQVREDRELGKRGYWFDAREADRVCTFFEYYIRHHKGEWAGTSLRLEPWQRRHLRRLFGWRRPEGTRRYRKTFWLVPRKNGKSVLVAGGTLYLLTADGEPGAEVYSLGANKEQASIVFEEAKRTVNASPDLSDLCTLYKQSIFVPSSLSRFMAVSGLPTGKHGFNPHGVSIDELHEFRDRGAFDAMTTGSAARRQSLVWMITTAGDDPHSLCFEEYDYAAKVRDGVVEDAHYLPVIYEAAADDDWKSEKVWAKANPNLGVSVSLEFLRNELQEAMKKPGREPAFRRFYLNQWVNNAQRWLSMESWNACSGPKLKPNDLERFKGRRCYGGLDLSKTTDLSSLVLVFPSDDGVYDVLARFWIPQESIEKRAKRDRVPYPQWAQEGWLKPTPGNVVDYRFIRHEVVALSKVLQIEQIGYDRLFAGELVQNLQDQDGLTMVEVGQGYVSMAAPTAELERLVTAGLLRHFANPVLRWNASNVVVRVDPAGNMKPDKGRSTERIDGVVALIMAIARTIAGEGGRSVYESRGVLAI